MKSANCQAFRRGSGRRRSCAGARRGRPAPCRISAFNRRRSRVFRGASTPPRRWSRNPALPGHRRHAGKDAARVFVVTASARTVPAFTCGPMAATVPSSRTRPESRSACAAVPLVRDVDHVEPGHRLKSSADMRRATRAARGERACRGWPWRRRPALHASGNQGVTSITGTTCVRIGSKPFTVSYGMDLNMLGLMAWLLATARGCSRRAPTSRPRYRSCPRPRPCSRPRRPDAPGGGEHRRSAARRLFTLPA